MTIVAINALHRVVGVAERTLSRLLWGISSATLTIGTIHSTGGISWNWKIHCRGGCRERNMAWNVGLGVHHLKDLINERGSIWRCVELVYVPT